MSTEAYIRDPRFEAHGAAIKWSIQHPAKWYDERQLRQVLKEEDWSDVCVIHHHANFDGLILSHHYDVHPKMFGDTLSMARLLLGNHLSVSLDSVRKEFGFPEKKTPYHLFHGKYWQDIPSSDQQLIAEGACDEVESIWLLFGKLLQAGFPQEELSVVDATVKMFTAPVLKADVDLLRRIWEKEATDKAQRLVDLNIDVSELQSADKFKALLEAEGVEIAYKQGKNGPIPCFAKNDDFMRDLLEDEDDRIKGLAEARLGAKSSALQTRAETLGWMASRGAMCVYLRMYGAHTTRWSGGDGANWQNFRRKAQGALAIRDAILPPEGFALIEPDLSQVEARVLAYLAGQEDSLEEFRRGEDPYIKLASAAYGEQVYKPERDDPRRTEMETKRGTGKQLRLSCGFMAGAKTIQRTARLGIYGPPVIIDLDTATRWRDIYRESNPRVVEYWKTAGRMISRIAGGPPTEWGPFTIRDKRVYLPNGLRINYDTLEFCREQEEGAEFPSEGYWRVKKRNGYSKLYSGKLVENVVQFAARCIASQSLLRIVRMGYRIVNVEHDKHWVLIPLDGKEKEHIQQIIAAMSVTPDWLPGLPLAVECDFDQERAYQANAANRKK